MVTWPDMLTTSKALPRLLRKFLIDGDMAGNAHQLEGLGARVEAPDAINRI